MLNVRPIALEGYRHHIETADLIHQILFLKVSESDPGQLAPLSFIHPEEGRPETGAFPGLHFNEYEAILIPGNEVDLPPVTAVVPLKDFEPSGC